MAKVKKAYFCKECGAESAKWFGRCTSCGEWNSCTEEVISVAKSRNSYDSVRGVGKQQAVLVQQLENVVIARESMVYGEVDRVLGGGLVGGSLVLIGGEPGIGKSTLALQIALHKEDYKVLYVSGEESAEQIKLRADRVGIRNEQCLILSETMVENIILQAVEHSPRLIVIDSIQTIYSEMVDSSAGSISQVRECSSLLMKYAKQSGTPIIIIGHITKEGSIAGPKVLEHIVDVVFQFDGDSSTSYRILRSIKNRFGATSEIGVFEMLGSGLREVSNPSEIFIPPHSEPLSGIAIGAAMEGARPYLIETQALVCDTGYSVAQRSSTGFDYKRMGMIVAVLEKRLGFKLGKKDIFLNLVGGFKVVDTGLDLAFVAAIISSTLDVALGEKICFAGEVGLSGEVRPAVRTVERIAEASRIGFTKIVVSSYAKKAVSEVFNGNKSSIEIIYVSKVSDLAGAVFR